MTYKTATNALIGATTLYGIALPLLKAWGPDAYTPLMWIAPAFFYLYEMVFVLLMGKYNRMTPQKIVISSMIMRGVKFLGVAVMMLVWVACALPAKSAFLLYVLGYYLLTSLFEGWCVSRYNKEKLTTKE